MRGILYIPFMLIFMFPIVLVTVELGIISEKVIYNRVPC